MRAALFSTTCLAGLFAIAAPASAQTGSASQPLPASSTAATGPAAADQPPPPAPSSASADSSPRDDEIIVTGSLISRGDYKANSPISTISADSLATTGQPSLDRAIGELPQFAGAQGAAEVGDAQGKLGFSGGQAYGDLRGIGPNRSLVLLDGRRLMPSTPDGSIDLNTIPTALVENVEVITGGASATYGSDAIAGVVNFKLKRNFSGLELSAQHGGTTHGDGATNQISGAVGGNFADGRGNAVLAFEYSDRAEVKGSSRPFFQNIRPLTRPPEGEVLFGNFGSTGSPTIAAVNAVLAGYAGTTPIAGTGIYKGAIGVNTDGTVFTTLAAPNCAQNYKGLGTILGVSLSSNCSAVQVALGNYFDVQVPLKKYNAFGRITYDLDDDLSAYAQFGFTESTAEDTTASGSTKTSGRLILNVPQNSPFVTGNAGLRTILASITPAPTGPLKVTKLLTAFGNRVAIYRYDVWQALAGLKGTIPGTSLDFNLYGSFGRSLATTTGFGDVSLSAVNSILNGTATAAGCTGYAWNALGNNALSPGCLAYAGRTLHLTSLQTQKIVEGTVQGKLFSLPAGPVKFALGADHRVVDFDYQPDSALIASDTIPYDAVTAASGKQSVSEAFGELLVPLLADQPFAKELSLDLGYRYSKYDKFAGAHTWKADVSWAPIDALRFRGGYSVAIRAPSLLDLFGPKTVGQFQIGLTPGSGDPCDVRTVFRTGANGAKVQALCIAQGLPAAIASSYTYGSSTAGGTSGPNGLLTPEKADTWSIGAVITPKIAGPLLRDLQLSIDYYNIKIGNAIGSLALIDILPRCFNSDGVSNPGYSLVNPYCDRITRDPATGSIANGIEGLFNFATYSLDGIDTQINWRIGLDAFGASSTAGRIEIGSVVSYLRNYKVAGLLGSPTLNYAGSTGFASVGPDISHPSWKANTSLTYANGGFGVTGRWRYIGAMVNSDKVANPASIKAGVPAYNYFDLNAHYTFDERYTLGAGVTNIGDKDPPFIDGAFLTTDAAAYDVIGRRWFVSLKAKF
ncbi:MAG: TonB-dependent receptor [Croceibacterium sp.]